jgi:DNA (cytosine-5)-methyltransferase 1
MKLASFFSGAGGLDLGFVKAGFDVSFANEYDKVIWATYEKNHKGTKLDRRSIADIKGGDLPTGLVGFIGGPPCQSWSEAGAGRGINDHRGQLFFDYIRLISHAKPLFFLAENVSGILFAKHSAAFGEIKTEMLSLGYELSVQMVNANDYDVPQDRLRVIIVGYHKRLIKKLGHPYVFPKPITSRPTLEVIRDLDKSAVPALQKNKRNPASKVLNNEYMIGGHSTMFMSRNRVRLWDEPSFTIQAGGRHAPIHPSAGRMVKVSKDLFRFAGKDNHRRLSIRECARIQTFPDDFEFVYRDVGDGYKMIGNAVPVNLAYHLAKGIMKDVVSSKLA